MELLKLNLDNNPDGGSDVLVGGQYRYIFKPYTNQKSLSAEAKLLFNFTGKETRTVSYFDNGNTEEVDVWSDHLIISVPVYVSYNYKSWSVGAGFHLNIGNEGISEEANITQQGEKEGYDYGFAVPVLKLAYNLFDKINIEYNYDLSGSSQQSLGVGYYWNF